MDRARKHVLRYRPCYLWGGARSQINVDHHGWPTEKKLGFEWAKTTQLALKSLRFFRNIFEYVQSFSRVLFHKNSEI